MKGPAVVLCKLELCQGTALWVALESAWFDRIGVHRPSFCCPCALAQEGIALLRSMVRGVQ